jgi:hypothetical protein
VKTKSLFEHYLQSRNELVAFDTKLCEHASSSQVNVLSSFYGKFYSVIESRQRFVYGITVLLLCLNNIFCYCRKDKAQQSPMQSPQPQQTSTAASTNAPSAMSASSIGANRVQLAGPNSAAHMLAMTSGAAPSQLSSTSAGAQPRAQSQHSQESQQPQLRAPPIQAHHLTPTQAPAQGDEDEESDSGSASAASQHSQTESEGENGNDDGGEDDDLSPTNRFDGPNGQGRASKETKQQQTHKQQQGGTANKQPYKPKKQEDDDEPIAVVENKRLNRAKSTGKQVLSCVLNW